MALWKTEDWKPIEQSKPLPKGAAQIVMFTHHGAAACGEEPCLLLVRSHALRRGSASARKAHLAPGADL